MIELQNVSKIYNQGEITEMCLFDNFSLTIPDGQFLSVVGSNGSGKTSVLTIICGSIHIEKGIVIIDGNDITKVPDF